MKRLFVSAAATLVLATPAQASLLAGADLLKVAQVVLKGKALLSKGQSQCGSQLALAPQDNILMALAGNAVQKALPAQKFSAIDILAGKQADIAATQPGFCQTAQAKKPGILGDIADAAGKLGVGGGALGGLGGIGGLAGGALGGLGNSAPGNSAPSNTGASSSGLGNLLGGSTPNAGDQLTKAITGALGK